MAHRPQRTQLVRRSTCPHGGVGAHRHRLAHARRAQAAAGGAVWQSVPASPRGICPPEGEQTASAPRGRPAPERESSETGPAPTPLPPPPPCSRRVGLPRPWRRGPTRRTCAWPGRPLGSCRLTGNAAATGRPDLRGAKARSARLSVGATAQSNRRLSKRTELPASPEYHKLVITRERSLAPWQLPAHSLQHHVDTHGTFNRCCCRTASHMRSAPGERRSSKGELSAREARSSRHVHCPCSSFFNHSPPNIAKVSTRAID